MKIQKAIKDTQNGNHKAFRELVIQFSGRLMAVAKMMTKNNSDAEDVLQESLISMYKNINQFVGNTEQAFYGWAKKIVINKSLALYRRKYYSHENTQITTDKQLLQAPEIYDQFNREAFMNYVYQLPIQYRQTLCLYALEGYSHSEIAEIMNISESTSRSNFCRAKEKLKGKLPSNYRFTKII